MRVYSDMETILDAANDMARKGKELNRHNTHRTSLIMILQNKNIYENEDLE